MSDRRPMTMACPECGDQFGLWRPRCPACGWTVPYDVRQKALEPGERAGTERKSKSEKKTRIPDQKKANQCILCRRKAKPTKKSTMRCPHCSEPVHVVCFRMHEEPCKQFQLDRQAELAKLGKSFVDNTTRAVTDALKGR